LGVDLSDAFARLVDLVAGRVDVLVAHNASFDRSFLESNGLDLAKHFDVPWICSMSQIDWPRASGSKSLLATALAHDVAVTVAHRALADCQILARLFERCAELGSDLQVMLTRALRPSSRYVAQVSYDNRQQAKDAGFVWSAPEAPKCWSRIVADEDAGKFGFRLKKVS
jgi:DNA polymerase-3 subunit epsilon